MSLRGGVGRLGLGTVQFGLDYGITNAAGRVGEAEAAAILSLAVAAGIDLLDTAPLYGESEALIGRVRPAGRALRIVSKTPKFGDLPADEARRMLRQACAASRERVGAACLDALLLHDVADLLGPSGPALWEEMTALRSEGQTARIGVSLYEGEEIDRVLDRLIPDVVQLPWNPLDHRLVDGGQLARLHAAGVEVHARSLFLQGLLLQDPGAIPASFGPVREAVAALDDRFGAAGLSRLEGILALAFQRPEVSRFIIGVTRTAELQAIVSAAEKVLHGEQRLDIPACRLNPIYLNPARWPELERRGTGQQSRT